MNEDLKKNDLLLVIKIERCRRNTFEILTLQERLLKINHNKNKNDKEMN